VWRRAAWAALAGVITIGAYTEFTAVLAEQGAERSPIRLPALIFVVNSTESSDGSVSRIDVRSNHVGHLIGTAVNFKCGIISGEKDAFRQVPTLNQLLHHFCDPGFVLFRSIWRIRGNASFDVGRPTTKILNMNQHQKREVAYGFWAAINSAETYPWAIFSLHFPKLAFDGGQLSVADNSLGNSGPGSNYREYSNPSSRGSRDARRPFLGCFLAAFGAVLMKLSFYFGDTPRPKRDDRWLTWGTGVIAAFLIAQGTVLALTGFWVI
jgi:hypothetical protein